MTRTPLTFERTSVTTTPPLTQVPTIRLTTATPFTSGSYSARQPKATTILAPKAELETRKRLVPKKSKLSLLGGAKKEKSKDLSDVARRVGAQSPTLGRSFEIYVDPADDPDIGEIVVLKKKKSRVGLNELHWGALDDVTNTGKEQKPTDKNEVKKPVSADATHKARDDEKEKWWTKRGRKDSKNTQRGTVRMKSSEKLIEATKENSRKPNTGDSTMQPTKTRKTITVEESKNSDRRQRSQSLDAGMVLGTTLAPINTNFISVPMPDDDEVTPRRGHVRTNTSPSLYGERPATLEGIAAVTQPSKDEGKPKNGSIALRAIRSVRSLARIGSWAHLKHMPDDDEEQPPKKSKDKPERKETKKKERTMSVSSKSSFGVLKHKFGSIRKSVDLSGTIRSLSSETTAVSSSSDVTVSHSRRTSGASDASTIRHENVGSVIAKPVIGRAPKSSGSSTIRWDDQVETIRNQRSSTSPTGIKNTRGKKRSPEGLKRPGLASLFPDLMQNNGDSEAGDAPMQTVHPECPEAESETSTTLLGISGVLSLDSPSRRVRPRPLSEQMLGRERPRGIIGDKDTGVIRILDDVTTDLACLINRLDLEATPTSSPVNETPRVGVVTQSRVDTIEAEEAKKPARQLSMEKLLGSFRSYKHRQNSVLTSAAEVMGGKIAPWPKVNEERVSFEQCGCQSISRRQGSYTSVSPPTPHEPSPIIHALPAPSRPASNSSLEKLQGDSRILEAESALPASFATFGKKQSSSSQGSATPMKGKGRHARGGRGSSASQSGLDLEAVEDVFSDAKTRLARAKRGTLGSVVSQSISFDVEDPDCDIPCELRMLLNENSKRTASCSAASYQGKQSSVPLALPPSPGTPPREPLPPVQTSDSSYRIQLSGELSEFNDDAFIASYDDENDTKQSFDFTAELNNLGCSRATDNANFVMQLEQAFKTPRKYSVRGLGATLGFAAIGSPDVSTVQEESRHSAREVALPESPSPKRSTTGSEEGFINSSVLESSVDCSHDEDICVKQPARMHRHTMSSRPSHGCLDLNFKFGRDYSENSEVAEASNTSRAFPDKASGSPTSSAQSHSSDGSIGLQKPREMMDFISPLADHSREHSQASPESTTSNKQLTLSEVIPPPEHESRRYSYSSLSEDESAMLQSILEKAFNLSNASLSLDSDRASTSAGRQNALDRLVAHSRQNSDVSFSGLSSYSERRRGFEFGTVRPTFYPPQPPVANNSLLVPNAVWRNSILSLGSVSSYGRVVRDGAKDPFDFPVPGRRISEDMSYTVEDTFSFLRHDPARQRVDSGASEYSIASHIRPDAHLRRSRRQVESMVSVTSGPPISLYNRGFNAGRTTSSWRQRTSSFESVASGFSAYRLGRPGVGDKMFESACGVPLTSISASPSQAETSMDWQSAYDSVVDGDRDQDSLMDDTRRCSLIGSQESLFGHDSRHPNLLVPPQFRPVSVYSFETQESPKRDTDTIISMIGGGFVRRRSIRSALENSPCARIEKRQQKHCVGKVLTRIPSSDDYDYSINGSPDKARLISRPSYTSLYSQDVTRNSIIDKALSGIDIVEKQPCESLSGTEAPEQVPGAADKQNPDVSRVSAYFGGERMGLAQKGLLERRSLEDCCLSAEGEDSISIKPLAIAFRRPEPAARKRSASTGQVTITSGTDTPPLSRSSTQFTGSQGSIDLDRLNALLAAPANPTEYDKSRLRRRGSGHRRRINEARASRASSVYETIEEAPELLDSTFTEEFSKHSLDSTMSQNLSSSSNVVRWENEDVGPALRMMRELQNEARMAVDASRRQWEDTAYSIDALQSFQPPNDPASWKVILEYSQKNFGPLPPELQGCTRRSRKISRPSPYPRVRVFTRPPSVQQLPVPGNAAVPNTKFTAEALRSLTNSNAIANIRRWGPVFKPMKPAVSEGGHKQPGGVERNTTSPRMSMLANACKLVPGAAKRNAGKSPRVGKQNKENTGQGTSVRAESLRISRPRPMGRPAAIPRTIRI